MDSLIQTFHLDVKLIIAQLFNFLVVAGVLWFFAAKPLIKILQERANKIENSLKEAKQIEEKIVRTEAESRKIIGAAQKEAKAILDKTMGQAQEKKLLMISQAKQEMEKIVSQGKAAISAEKEKMVKEAKGEILDLAILAAEKFLSKKIDAKADQELISQALAELKKK